MTVARLLILFLAALAVALLVSTVLVQMGVRQRVAIVAAAIATPVVFVAVPLLPALIARLSG
ncbi:hypothetical protein [Aureimonas leprariae]|uniref:Uncharacterized protein n=1 Tax=Plantimonas leprariae TaxID=2615207 RepID=A0A7V7PQU8_9HYPH|nr:hypothetical protein [Aureimonas leprariae]KAB0680800.1 hypothetical protein F6X38_07355 [Aureimonas leprariae]